MKRITVVIETVNPAQCPVCRNELDPCGFWVQDNVAFCRSCYHDCTAEAIGLECDYGLSGNFTDLFRRVHGVIFFNPDVDLPADCTAAELAERRLPGTFAVPTFALIHAGKRHRTKVADALTTDLPNHVQRRRATPSQVDHDQHMLLANDPPLDCVDTHRS